MAGSMVSNLIAVRSEESVAARDTVVPPAVIREHASIGTVACSPFEPSMLADPPDDVWIIVSRDGFSRPIDSVPRFGSVRYGTNSGFLRTGDIFVLERPGESEAFDCEWSGESAPWSEIALQDRP